MKFCERNFKIFLGFCSPLPFVSTQYPKLGNTDYIIDAPYIVQVNFLHLLMTKIEIILTTGHL